MRTKKGFSKTERVRGKANFSLFARAKQFKGVLLRVAVVLPSENSQHIADASGEQFTVVKGRKAVFSVSKKILPLAVDRNKLKRRLRGIYSEHKALLPSDIWVMIIALPGVKSADYAGLENETKQLFADIAAKVAGS